MTGVNRTSPASPDYVAIPVNGVLFPIGNPGRIGPQPQHAAFLKPSSPEFMLSFNQTLLNCLVQIGLAVKMGAAAICGGRLNVLITDGVQCALS